MELKRLASISNQNYVILKDIFTDSLTIRMFKGGFIKVEGTSRDAEA